MNTVHLIGIGADKPSASRVTHASPEVLLAAIAHSASQPGVVEAAARKVVDAFEALGRTSDTAGLLQAKAHCENSMTALKAALGQAPEALVSLIGGE